MLLDAPFAHGVEDGLGRADGVGYAVVERVKLPVGHDGCDFDDAVGGFEAGRRWCRCTAKPAEAGSCDQDDDQQDYSKGFLLSVCSIPA